MNKIKTALISVSDKEGITDLATKLKEFQIEILSTGGTAKSLKEAGIDVTEISEYIKSPELLGGRVKTLHPKIHAGILAVRDNNTHLRELEKHGIKSIDLLVVNLYPFKEVIKNEKVSLSEAIENIDIGGPTMLRAGAKNYKYVTVVVNHEDYGPIIRELNENNGSVSIEANFMLAVKAFSHVADYDAAISNFLSSIQVDNERARFPQNLTFHFERKMGLRYGENPHQSAAYYVDPNPSSGSIAASSPRSSPILKTAFLPGRSP